MGPRGRDRTDGIRRNRYRDLDETQGAEQLIDSEPFRSKLSSSHFASWKSS